MSGTVKDKNLQLLMLTSLMVSMSLNAIMPIQPLLISETGATNVELGLILAVSSMVALISRIPLSILAERIGKRITIIIALIVQFTSTISFYFIKEVAWFYPIMILQSMIWGLFGPPVISLVSDMASQGRIGRVMGMYYTSIGLGQFIGPLLCSILMNSINIRQMFLVSSTLPIVGLLSALRLKSSVKKGSMEKDIYVKKRNILNSFRRILRSRNIISLCLTRISFGFSVAIVGILLPVWTQKDLQFTTSMISILFAARGATNTFIRMPTGGLVDKIGNKKPVLIAFSLATTSFLIFSISNEFTYILIAMCIYGLAWGMRIVPDTAILKVNVESEDMGLALAILMCMFAIGKSVGSYFAGAMFNVLSISLIFQLSALALFLGIIVITISIRD